MAHSCAKIRVSAAHCWPRLASGFFLLLITTQPSISKKGDMPGGFSELDCSPFVRLIFFPCLRTRNSAAPFSLQLA